MTSQTASSTSAPTVRIDRLLPTGQFYGVNEADYVDLMRIVSAVSGATAIPKKEVAERVNRMIEHTYAPSIFLVARTENDVVVGFCISETGNTANTSHVGWLRMDVHPDFQGKGIGTQLLGAMLSTAQRDGLRRLEITSYAPNLRARKLFQSFGFKTEGKHTYARRDPETNKLLDTYTLAKILNGVS